MITISNYANKDLNMHDELWFITNTVPKAVVGSKHVPELAPPRDVFNAYVSGECSLDKLFNSYRFRLENDEDTLKKIDELIELSKTKWIQLVCYCKEHNKCHRSILAEYLMNRGVEVRLLS